MYDINSKSLLFILYWYYVCQQKSAYSADIFYIIRSSWHVITVFCPGFQKGRVPSEKGTLAWWMDRQKGTLARWTEEKGHN